MRAFFWWLLSGGYGLIALAKHSKGESEEYAVTMMALTAILATLNERKEARK